MTITRPLVYFKNKTSFNDAKNGVGDVRFDNEGLNNKIVFVGDEGKIYSHDGVFGGASNPEDFTYENLVLGLSNTIGYLKVNNTSVAEIMIPTDNNSLWWTEPDETEE